MQSLPITTKIVSLNPTHGEVYSIQYYVIKFVSDLWQVGGFLRALRFPSPIKNWPPRYKWQVVESEGGREPQCYTPLPLPEYSWGERNPLYPILAASFVSKVLYILIIWSGLLLGHAFCLKVHFWSPAFDLYLLFVH